MALAADRSRVYDKYCVPYVQWPRYGASGEAECGRRVLWKNKKWGIRLGTHGVRLAVARTVAVVQWLVEGREGGPRPVMGAELYITA